MDPILAQLVAIAALDDRRLSITEEGKRLRRKLDASDEHIQALTKQLEAVTNAHRTRRQREGTVRDEVRQVEQRRQRSQQALEDGGRGAEGAERQIAACTERIDLLETELLESMEISEQQGIEQAELEVELTSARNAHAMLARQLDPRLHELRGEVNAVNEQRKPLIAALPREERTSYQQLIKLKNTALAEVRDKACSACGQLLPVQHLLDVRDGRRVVCAGCARWLYVSR